MDPDPIRQNEIGTVRMLRSRSRIATLVKMRGKRKILKMISLLRIWIQLDPELFSGSGDRNYLYLSDPVPDKNERKKKLNFVPVPTYALTVQNIYCNVL